MSAGLSLPRFARFAARRSRALAPILLLLTVSPTSLSAAPPATQPAAPTTQATAGIARWFDDLADPDPAVRSAAQIHLASLPATFLPTLRQVVQNRAYLRPSQTEVLYDIVTHVFLSGQTYAATDQGFLGIKPGAGYDGDPDHVEVCQRIIGFGAYAVLQDGDLILAIDDVAVTNQRFTELILHIPPGHNVTLSILRQGCPVRVAVPVASRPAALNDDIEGVKFSQERQQAAQDYWNRNFAALIKSKQSNPAQ